MTSSAVATPHGGGDRTPGDPKNQSHVSIEMTPENDVFSDASETRPDKKTDEDDVEKSGAQDNVNDGCVNDVNDDEEEDEEGDDSEREFDKTSGCARCLRDFDFSTVNPFEFSPDFKAESVFVAQRFRAIAKKLADKGLSEDVIIRLLSKSSTTSGQATTVPLDTSRSDERLASTIGADDILNDATEECEAEMKATGGALERSFFGLFFKDKDANDQYRLFAVRTVLPLTVSIMYNVGNLTMGPTKTLTGRLLPYRYFWSGASLVVLSADMFLHFVYVPSTKRIAYIRMFLTYAMAVVAIGITSWYLYYVHLYCDEMVDLFSYLDGRHPLDGPRTPIDCVRQMDAISITGPTMCLLALCMHPIPMFVFCIVYVLATVMPRAFVDTPAEKEEHWQLLFAKVIVYVALVVGAVMQSYFRNRQWQLAFEETVNVRRKQDQAAKDNDEIEGLICTLVPTAVLPRLMALGTNTAAASGTDSSVDESKAEGQSAASKSHNRRGDGGNITDRDLENGLSLERMFASLSYDKSVDRAQGATVLFADMKGFTRWSTSRTARDVATMLNTVVAEIDSLVYTHDGVEKIKTIGDAYWAVTGLPEEFSSHADVMLRFAFDMVRCIDELNAVHPEWDGIYWRTAVHSGPLAGAILGTRQTSYEVFGRTLMVCQKVEAAGIPGRVCCTDSTLRALSEDSPLMALMERFDNPQAAIQSIIDDANAGRSLRVPASGRRQPSTRPSVVSSASPPGPLQLPNVISQPEVEDHTVEFVDYCALDPSETRAYVNVLDSNVTVDAPPGAVPTNDSKTSGVAGEGTKRKLLVQRTKVPVFTFVPTEALRGRSWPGSQRQSRDGSLSRSSEEPRTQSAATASPLQQSASEGEYVVEVPPLQDQRNNNGNNSPAGASGEYSSSSPTSGPRVANHSLASGDNNTGEGLPLPVVHTSGWASASGSVAAKSTTSRSTNAASTTPTGVSDIKPSSQPRGVTSLLLGRRMSNGTRKVSNATRGSKSTKAAHFALSIEDRRSKPASKYRSHRVGKKSSLVHQQSKAERKKEMEEKQRAVKEFIRQRVAMHKATLASGNKKTAPARDKLKASGSSGTVGTVGTVSQSPKESSASASASASTSQRGSPFASQPTSPTEQKAVDPHHVVAVGESLQVSSSVSTIRTQDATQEHTADTNTETHKDDTTSGRTKTEDNNNKPATTTTPKPDDEDSDVDSEAELDEEQKQERRITKTKYRFLVQSFKDAEVEFRYGIFAAQSVLWTMKGAAVGSILLLVCVVASFGLQDNPCVTAEGLALNGIAILLSLCTVAITSIPLDRNPILRPVYAASPTVYGKHVPQFDGAGGLDQGQNNASGQRTSTDSPLASTATPNRGTQDSHNDAFLQGRVSPKYLMLIPMLLLLVAFTLSIIGTSLSSHDNCFIGIDRTLVPVFGCGMLPPLVGLLSWYEMLVLIVVFIAGPGVGFSWWSLVRFNSVMVIVQGGICMAGLVMYVLEKFLRLQFSEKEMGKLMEQRLYDLREGREAVLATVVPRHVIPDLFKWFAHDMAPDHAVARSFDRIVVGFIHLCKPPTALHRVPSTSTIASEEHVFGADAGADPDVEAEEAELAETDDPSWMLQLHAEVDHLISRQTHISKVKTVGDVVMIAGPFFGAGQNETAGVQSTTLSDAALCTAVTDIRALLSKLIQRAPGFRAGIHVGPVFGACQGSSRLSFDIFGDPVNVASRIMTGQPRGSSAVSSDIRDILLRSPDTPVRVWAETQLGEPVVRTAKGKGEITIHEIQML